MKINKRNVVKGIAASSLFANQAFARSQPKPNIIFIMADDLGYADLSITGSPYINTPNIDSIGNLGLRFTNGYANSCICSPTRVGLATGCYQQRFEVGLEEPLGPNARPGIGIPPERRTIASVLKEQGYTTSLIGKWHLGEPPNHSPLQHGYDHYFGILPGGADYFRHRMVVGGNAVGPNLHEDDHEISRTGYLTDIFTEEAVNYIRSPKDKPFFLSMHFTSPHWPWEGREDEELARTLRSTFHYDGGNIRKYKEMVEILDESVGKILAAIRATGNTNNTIVIFTSDNGGERFSNVWPFVGMKGELLEGGIRVPILIKWPNKIRRNQTTDQVMISMDFLPTLLAAAGGEAPNGEFDGMNLLPQIIQNSPKVERTLFWRFKANAQAAVRQGDWKYLKLGNKEHLYNLAQDEHERAELNHANPQKFAELKALYAAWNANMLEYPANTYSQDNRDTMSDRY